MLTLLPRGPSSSFFKGINRVEAGHVVGVTPERFSVRRFWNPDRPRATRMSTDDYVEGLRHHLDQATRARLRGATAAVATQLSGGFDSGAVTATAARLLAPAGGKVVAFTAVPREGYDGPVSANQIADEGPLAATVAAMYPNIEHVQIRATHVSPLDALDRIFFLYEAPIIGLANMPWGRAVQLAARQRKLTVMLTGQMGNMTLSYTGFELLPELLLAGRLASWWHNAAQLVAKGNMRWRGALAQTFGPFMPEWCWQWLNRVFRNQTFDLLRYTALRADSLAAHDLLALARIRNLDIAYRPWADGFDMRTWVFRRGDPGNGVKGALGDSGIDLRDPTSDRRLVEFCLSIPTEEYLRDGVPRALAKRALADRLPAAVLDEKKIGYQAADWHEGLTAVRGEAAAEIERFANCAPAAALLDVERLKRLMANWPTSGWERPDVRASYRLALLRGISAGHFLRKASGANR